MRTMLILQKSNMLENSTVVIDFVAIIYICKDKHLFRSLNVVNLHIVKFGDGCKCCVTKAKISI